MSMTKREKLQVLVEQTLREVGNHDARGCELRPVTGWYRSSPWADTYRFEGTVWVNGYTKNVVGWSTMTKCLKQGITIDWEDGQYEVDPKPS